MNKKLLFASFVLTAILLAIFSLSSVSAQYYSNQDDNRYQGSFRPSHYSGNSFKPHTYNSYSNYPSNRYNPYPYSNYKTYNPTRINSNPSFLISYRPSNLYNFPPYLGSYNRPTNAYQYPLYANSYAGNYFPHSNNYLSNSNTFNNKAFNDFNQKARINSQNSYNFNRGPCVTYTKILDFHHKRNDVYAVEKICDDTNIRQLSSDSFSNNINTNSGFNNRNFGNSQYFNY